MDLSKLSDEELQALLDRVKEETRPRDKGSILDPILQGATFGFSDELGGFGSQLGKFAATGEWDSDQYEKGRDEQRRNLEDFAYRNPKTALAAEIAGSIGTGGLASAAGKQIGARAMAAAPGVAQRLLNAPKLLQKTLGASATGATEGALYGAGAADENALEGAVQGALTGAKFGAGTELGSRALGRTWKALGRPMGVSRDAARLQREANKQGIDLNMTAGQLADDSFLGNIVKGVEQGIERVPGAGKLMQARSEAMGNWNLSEIRNALPKDLADKVGAPGPGGMAQVRALLSNAYEEALSPLAKGAIKVNDEALDTLSYLQQRASNRIPQNSAGAVLKDIDNLFEDLFRNKIDGNNIKQWESDLGTKMRNAGQGGNIEEAKIYEGMLNLLRDQRDKAVGKKNAQRLRDIDEAYAKLIPIRDAQGMMGALKEGFFTPSQLLSGAQRQQRGWGKAEVRNPMGKRALAAENVFGSTIPRTGSPTMEKMAAQMAIGATTSAAMDLAQGQPLDAADALIAGFGTPAVGRMLPKARKFFIGKTGGQKKMRNLQKTFERYLETLSPAARRAFILANSEEE
jgi:hypothetical protein